MEDSWREGLGSGSVTFEPCDLGQASHPVESVSSPGQGRTQPCSAGLVEGRPKSK